MRLMCQMVSSTDGAESAFGMRLGHELLHGHIWSAQNLLREFCDTNLSPRAWAALEEIADEPIPT
jgi:hypothetical protein